MTWWQRPVEVDDTEGEPGLVLDRDGLPVLDADGSPLHKVLVVTQRDHQGNAERYLWCDPRFAHQWHVPSWDDF